VAKDEEGQPRSSSSSSSSAIRRRDSVCRRDSEDSVAARRPDLESAAKRMRLDDEAAPRLRLNASLATDPALRPAAVAVLTVKPENASPPNPTPPPLPAGLQNGEYSGISSIPFCLLNLEFSEINASSLASPVTESL